MKTKRCSKCGLLKCYSEYYQRHEGAGVYSLEADCKLCRCLNVKRYRIANAAKVKATAAAYRSRNKEKIAFDDKKYRDKNKVRLSAQSKRYREVNKDKLCAHKRIYRRSNSAKLCAKQRQIRWRKNNPDKATAISRRTDKVQCRNLTDGYVRKLLRKNTVCAIVDIPPELIGAKREYLKIRRLLLAS